MEPLILYNNILASGLTATDTASGYSVDNVYDYRAGSAWVANSSGTKYLTMDAGEAVTVDGLGLYTHNLGTAEATVSVESSTTGAWSGEEVEQLSFSPTDDKAIFKPITSATIRHWRVKIVTASVAADISCLFLGERMDFPCYADSPFTPEIQSINATANYPKGGHFLDVTNYYTPLQIKTSFTFPTMFFIDGAFDIFWVNHGRKLKPFFWVPSYSDYPDKVYYVRMDSPRSVSQSDTVYADSLKLTFKGVAE